MCADRRENKPEEAPSNHPQPQPFHGRGELVRIISSSVTKSGANVQILSVCLQAYYLTPEPQAPLILSPKVRPEATVVKLSD